MRSILSDLYPEPRPGRSATEDEVQATTSLPSALAVRRLSRVNAVSSLFSGERPKRPGERQRAATSASSPNTGRRRTSRPARPRAQTSGTTVSSSRRTSGAPSNGGSPRDPRSSETLVGNRTDTGQPTSQSSEQPVEQGTTLSAQQAEQTSELETEPTSSQPSPQQSVSTTDQTPEQQTESPSPGPPTTYQTIHRRSDQPLNEPPGQTTAQPVDQVTNETSDQTSDEQQELTLKEWSPGTAQDRGPPGAEDLDSEGRSVTSESTSHTDTETLDADEERASLISEPFSSGPDDEDADSQRGTAESTMESDDMSVSSPRSSRRVTFDENAPETLMFTPESGGGGRGSEDEGSMATVSTDSDSEESSGDSFKRLLEMLRERSLTPVGRHGEDGETSGRLTVDPDSHVARYLREQRGGQTDEDDESDIQEDEPHPHREERRLAFPNEPVPGQRRSSFENTIDEFLHYLQAIAEDHKAHQEAMTLLDEEPEPADGSDLTSEAGDSAWSETTSEMVDSVSDAGSVQTDKDSGLATSPPPGEDAGRAPDDRRVSAPIPGGSGGSEVETDASAQSDILQEKSLLVNDIRQEGQHEPTVEADIIIQPSQSDSDPIDRQEDSSSVSASEPDKVTNNGTMSNNSAAEDVDQETAISPEHAPPGSQTTVQTSGLSHEDNQPAGANQKTDQLATAEAIRARSEGEREDDVTDPPPLAADSSPTRSGDSSRESSAADSRRGSAILRSLLRASLPAVEVLGSHSDTDTLRERRASLVTGSAGGLLPPTADLQGRSPGQAGSLETMAKSPGELSKQPTPADSGEASEAVSESELSHYQPVRSLASIADRLLRGDSEEEAPRVAPSGIGPANSMAAISGQLLTDRSPGEPVGPAEMAAIDEDDDETELHSILMHGEDAEHTKIADVKPGETVVEPVETEGLATLDLEMGEVEKSKVDTERLNTSEADELETDTMRVEGDMTAEDLTTVEERLDGEKAINADVNEKMHHEEATIGRDNRNAEIPEDDVAGPSPESRKDEDAPIETEEVLAGEFENEDDGEADVPLKAEKGTTDADAEKSADMNKNRAEAKIEAVDIEKLNKENIKMGNDAKEMAIKVDDEERAMEAGNTALERGTGAAVTDVNAEDITVKEEVEETENRTSEENMSRRIEIEQTVKLDDVDGTLIKENTEETVPKVTPEETSGPTIMKTDTDGTTAEDITVEQVSGTGRESHGQALDTGGSDRVQNDRQNSVTADDESDIAPESTNYNETKAAEQIVITKEPEGSTSMTEGAPNIAIQTSTRLTLDIDGLGPVTSDISRQQSEESYSENDESGSGNDSDHSDVNAENGTSAETDPPIDEEKAHLEALALLRSEVTGESSLQGTVRTYVRGELVMSEARRIDDSREGLDNERMDPDSALSADDADESKQSDGRSSVLSDLLSEESERTLGREMSQGGSRKNTIRLTSDGESITTLDDDEIFESETITRLGNVSNISARKLVWSLIAMASGLAEQIRGSEARLTSKTEFPQPEEQNMRSQVKVEDKAGNDPKNTDDSARAKSKSPKSDKPTPDGMDDHFTEREESTSLTKKQFKEINRPQVKEIIRAAQLQFEETIKQDEQKSAEPKEELLQLDESMSRHVGEQIIEETEIASIATEQSKERNRPQIQEIIRAAGLQLEETMKDDAQRANDYDKEKEQLFQSEKGILRANPDQIPKEVGETGASIERLKEIHRPRVKQFLEAAEVQVEQSVRHYIKDNGDSVEGMDGVSHSDTTLSDVIYDQITKEAERRNISMDHLREIHGPHVKEIVKAAETQIIMAAHKVISIVKESLSREMTNASEHEAPDSDEVNYSPDEVEAKSFSERGDSTPKNETLGVNQNLPVDLGENDFTVEFGDTDVQPCLESENIQDTVRNRSNENVSRQSSDTKAGEKAFLLRNVIYEVIPKRGNEIANLQRENIEQITDDLDESEPSPQDIANIAVAIIQSAIGEASDIIDDEETAARRLRVRQSITYAREGSSAADRHSKPGMDEEAELTSETNGDSGAPPDSDDFDDPADGAQEEPGEVLDAGEEGAADAAASPQKDTPKAEAEEFEESLADDSLRPADSPDEAADDDEQPVEPKKDEPEPSSLSESEESDTMMDEGQDTMDSNRIRYETGEIADQTQNVTSDAGITEEMLNSEPKEGAVTVETDVAGADAAGEPVEDVEAVDDETGDNKTVEAKVAETDAVDADDADVSKNAVDSDSKLVEDRQEPEVDTEKASVDDFLDVSNDRVTVSVMNVDETEDPLDPNLVELPMQESDALLPMTSLKKQSSWLAKDIVAPDYLATEQSGSIVEPMNTFAKQNAKEAAFEPDAVDESEKKDDGDVEDILAQYAEDMDMESSRETEEETTRSGTSSGSQDTLKDEEAAPPGGKDNVFDWLRRVSTQMDEMGITDQLKELYGDDVKQPIVMAPAEEEDAEIPELPSTMVSPKSAYSDTGMYHQSSLSLDTTYRIRQSSTQTDAKEDSGECGVDSDRKGRPGAARYKPCGSCRCCLAMKRVVSGSEGITGVGGVRDKSTPQKQQQRQQQGQQRPWTSPTRSIGDLLGDTSSATVSSTGTASSVDGSDSYARRMKHPKRWLKQATDEFMRRECIRQVVLKNDLVSDGRIQTKVTRISRHPSSMTDCLAATRDRALPGQSLQMEISKGETVVGGRTVNYQDVKIRTPKSCSGLSVRSAPRVRSNRPTTQNDDISKRFIDTYLEQSKAGSHSGTATRNGRESKTRKKITIKTDCRG